MASLLSHLNQESVGIQTELSLNQYICTHNGTTSLIILVTNYNKALTLCELNKAIVYKV